MQIFYQITAFTGTDIYRGLKGLIIIAKIPAEKLDDFHKIKVAGMAVFIVDPIFKTR